MPGGLPWDHPDAEPLEDIRRTVESARASYGDLTFQYDPDAADHPVFAKLAEGASGYLVERRGGRTDPVTGEPIYEPGDPVWVYPVKVGPPPVPPKLSWWRRLLAWWRKPEPEDDSTIRVSFTGTSFDAGE